MSGIVHSQWKFVRGSWCGFVWIPGEGGRVRIMNIVASSITYVFMQRSSVFPWLLDSKTPRRLDFNGSLLWLHPFHNWHSCVNIPRLKNRSLSHRSFRLPNPKRSFLQKYVKSSHLRTPKDTDTYSATHSFCSGFRTPIAWA